MNTSRKGSAATRRNRQIAKRGREAGRGGRGAGVPSSSANGMDWAYSWSCASKGYHLAVSKLLARCWLLQRQFGTVGWPARREAWRPPTPPPDRPQRG